MPIRALTIDFWNTMVVARTGGEARQRQRLDHVLGVARLCRPGATEELVREAFRAATKRYQTAWQHDHRTPACSDLVGGIWDALGIDADAEQHAEAVRIFEEGLLFGPPDLAEGLDEALAWAAGRYRLGLLSDTMFSPGRVIRRLLDERGLLSYFHACVFSDETGAAKPARSAFDAVRTALDVPFDEIVHIGDLRRTDVAGAQQAGARALLYTGIREDAEGEAEPDAVLPHWDELPRVLNQLTT